MGLTAGERRRARILIPHRDCQGSPTHTPHRTPRVRWAPPGPVVSTSEGPSESMAVGELFPNEEMRRARLRFQGRDS